MTSAVVIFRDRTGAIVLIIYVNHDGYPESLGLMLARFLMVSSTSFGCLVAQAMPLLALCPVDDDDEDDNDESAMEQFFLDADLVVLEHALEAAGQRELGLQVAPHAPKVGVGALEGEHDEALEELVQLEPVVAHLG